MFVIFVCLVNLNDRWMIKLFEYGNLVNERLMILDFFLVNDLDGSGFMWKEVGPGLINCAESAFTKNLKC